MECGRLLDLRGVAIPRKGSGITTSTAGILNYYFFQVCGDAFNSIQHSYKGCQLSIESSCASGHSCIWKSSLDLGRMADINLLSSAAVLYTGSTYTEIAEYFNLLDVAFLSSSTFYSIQRKYLIPTIQEFFNEQLNLILQLVIDLRHSVPVMGDGR